MPRGRTQRSKTVLYSLITFVGISIVATALAAIFYLRTEKLAAEAAASKKMGSDLANPTELRNIGAIIGTKQSGKSRIGTMVDYLDGMVSLITGAIPEETSAEVKVETASSKARNMLAELGKKHPDFQTIDPNTIGLIRVIEKLQTKAGEAVNLSATLEQQLENIQKKFDDISAVNAEKLQIISAENEKHKQRVDKIKEDYEELEGLMKQSTEQQVQYLSAQLDGEKNEQKKLNQHLLKTQAELKMAEERIKHLQGQLQKIVPPPDSEMTAFKADGKIILIDEQNKIVHLNLGSKDRIYQGLTFSVYDKNAPIPKDGKGKAKIELFSIQQNSSTARIVSAEKKNPIILDDIIANLIWASDRTNIFVVAGDFDLNDDGRADYDGADKIKAFIENWGGRVNPTVSIDADFVILGTTPAIYTKPTFETIEADPMAMEKYERSLSRLTNYREVSRQAQELAIPIFNLERFLCLIGR